MKLLILEDYLKSANAAAGISEEKQCSMISECIEYLDKIAANFHVHPHVQGIAMNIFHFYIKQVPFTEVERIMLTSVCIYLACKIDYYHFKMFDFIKYYHENKKGPKKRKAVEDVYEVLLNDFSGVELQALRVIEFDFNFDLPHSYLRGFRERYFDSQSI